MVVDGKVAAAEFCQFLQRLVHNAPRPIFLILDGHPVHRSVRVKQLVQSLKGNLELFFLPPYLPELNPDEWAWNDLKNDSIGRMAITGPDGPRRKLVDYLKQMQHLPVLIRSFLQTPPTSHAAAV